MNRQDTHQRFIGILKRSLLIQVTTFDHSKKIFANTFENFSKLGLLTPIHISPFVIQVLTTNNAILSEALRELAASGVNFGRFH